VLEVVEQRPRGGEACADRVLGLLRPAASDTDFGGNAQPRICADLCFDDTVDDAIIESRKNASAKWVFTLTPLGFGTPSAAKRAPTDLAAPPMPTSQFSSSRSWHVRC